MPTVYVMGYVEPKELKLCLEGLTPVVWEDIKTKERYSYLVTILDCIVSVECVLDKFEDTDTFISQLSNRAADMTRLVVDLLAFRRGLGATVYINEFIDPDGKEHRLIHHSGGIKCT